MILMHFKLIQWWKLCVSFILYPANKQRWTMKCWFNFHMCGWSQADVVAASWLALALSYCDVWFNIETEIEFPSSFCQYISAIFPATIKATRPSHLPASERELNQNNATGCLISLWWCIQRKALAQTTWKIIHKDINSAYNFYDRPEW